MKSRSIQRREQIQREGTYFVNNEEAAFLLERIKDYCLHCTDCRDCPFHINSNDCGFKNLNVLPYEWDIQVD